MKEAAARRWVNAVNEDGTYGRWEYTMVTDPAKAEEAVTEAARKLGLLVVEQLA